MTHSGGKPHTNVGDRGQRYEVRARGYPSKEESVIGWAADLPGAKAMAQAIQKAPGCKSTTVHDRQHDNALVWVWLEPIPFDPACLELANHFLQDEPKLRHRADELASDFQQTAEDWISTEREDEP